jgi:hypothetical protein
VPADHIAHPPTGGRWWCCSVRGLGGEPDRVVAVQSDRYPDGSRVELNADAAAVQIGRDASCTARLDPDGAVLAVDVEPAFAPKAPPIWFAEQRQSNAEPPAVLLMAFTGAGVERGRLLDEAAVSNVAVRSDDQLGAVRWYPATGEVDQIYVQPQWRRRNVATCLLAAGSLLSVARGWPRFWADGQRTQLGEELRNGRAWSGRAADLTHLHPPMTPGE